MRNLKNNLKEVDGDNSEVLESINKHKKLIRENFYTEQKLKSSKKKNGLNLIINSSSKMKDLISKSNTKKMNYHQRQKKKNYQNQNKSSDQINNIDFPKLDFENHDKSSDSITETILKNNELLEKKKKNHLRNKSVDLKLPLNQEDMRKRVEREYYNQKNKNKSKNNYYRKRKKNFKKSSYRKNNRSIKSANINKKENLNSILDNDSQILNSPRNQKNSDLINILKKESINIFQELNLDNIWIKKHLELMGKVRNQNDFFLELQSKIIKILSIKLKKEREMRFKTEKQFGDFMGKYKDKLEEKF